MYLHEDKELFQDVILATAEYQKRPVSIIEKDYYVTMILKRLVEKMANCVFKGGTSLSKCYHAIDRFSEDIDIAFSEELTQGQRHTLKNKVIATISQELELPISNWNETKSRRDYNCYVFNYESMEEIAEPNLIPGVKMEVALGNLSYPTVKLPVDSYVYQYLAIDNIDIAEQYGLMPFEMFVQSVERTFCDKVFAVCDYYLDGNIQRHSRHIYDLYMLYPRITFDDAYKQLVSEIRVQRAQSKLSSRLSAQADVNISVLLKEIVDKDVYRNDYKAITEYFQKEPIAYETAIDVLRKIIQVDVF